MRDYKSRTAHEIVVIGRPKDRDVFGRSQRGRVDAVPDRHHTVYRERRKCVDRILKFLDGSLLRSSAEADQNYWVLRVLGPRQVDANPVTLALKNRTHVAQLVGLRELPGRLV
jgi:hypothetical protein